MFLQNKDYGLIKVSGPDAKQFLQGQLTCDLNEITATESRLGAHCNPQGRIISLFQVFFQQAAYYLLLPNNMLTIATQALKKYAVFFKTELSDASEQLDQVLAHPAASYFDIHLRIPVIYPATSGMLLPHELNLPELNAVSFNKGCFTGQEIIARMHYRGKLKKHLYRATIIHQDLPAPGSTVYYQTASSAEPCGMVVNAYQSSAAHQYDILIVLDETQAKNHHLFLNDQLQQFITLAT